MDDAVRYSRIVSYVRETPWAVMPETLEIITELLALRVAGHRLTRAEIQERIGPQAASKGAGAARAGSVAVIPLHGVIVHRADMFEEVSGMASIAKFKERFRGALADAGVGSIIIDIDSPGGSVDGVAEMADEIRAGREQKKIVAVANTLAASAAYWLGASAGEFVVTPSGEVGSIGVFAAHADRSKFLENEGVKVTLVSAGKFKTEGNPFEPLSDEARSAIQGRVNDYYDMFVSGVAKSRGVNAKAVREGFGEGRVVGAAEAVKLGMADRVATLDSTIDRMLGRKPASARAAIDIRKRRLALA